MPTIDGNVITFDEPVMPDLLFHKLRISNTNLFQSVYFYYVLDHGCGCGDTGAKLWYGDDTLSTLNFEVLPADRDYLHKKRPIGANLHLHAHNPAKSFRFIGGDPQYIGHLLNVLAGAGVNRHRVAFPALVNA